MGKKHADIPSMLHKRLIFSFFYFIPGWLADVASTTNVADISHTENNIPLFARCVFSLSLSVEIVIILRLFGVS